MKYLENQDGALDIVSQKFEQYTALDNLGAESKAYLYALQGMQQEQGSTDVVD